MRCYIGAVKVLMAAIELAPWMGEGTEASAMAELARGLAASGIGVTIAVPDYPVFREMTGLKRRKKNKLVIHTSWGVLEGAWTEAKVDGMVLALVEQVDFFERNEVYGKGDRIFDDNVARFAFFARAIQKIAEEKGADIIYSIGWPGALTAVWGRVEGRIPVVLGVESFVFQGDFPTTTFSQTGLMWDQFDAFEYHGRMNVLKAGLHAASAVVVPGGRFVRAVMEEDAGCGLGVVARMEAEKFHGILAGVDYDGCYDARTVSAMSAKASLRKAWLAEKRLDALPVGDEGMLLVCPLNLCGGRGLDVMLPVVERMLEFPLRLAIFGTPESTFASALQTVCLRNAGKIFFCKDDEEMRRAIAAADGILLPDALDAGDTHLACAMRAGAVPLAAACAGLHELVEDYDPVAQTGTGLIFYRRDSEALWDNFIRAVYLRRTGEWAKIAERAAQTNHSWEGAAARYGGLFHYLCGE